MLSPCQSKGHGFGIFWIITALPPVQGPIHLCQCHYAVDHDYAGYRPGSVDLDPTLQNYFWNYDNQGDRLVQLRFYPAQ
jgi:hypothetical protein